MRTRRVVLLDIGLEPSFDVSMQFAQGLLSSINADSDKPWVEVDFVRSRDRDTAFSTLTTDCSVLHVMAHSNKDEAGPAFSSDGGGLEVSLADLADWSADHSRGIACAAILADGCSTGTKAWTRAVRDCLQGPITYVGTDRLVYWFDATVYTSAFYGALLRNRGRGFSPQEQVKVAADRASEAFTLLTDRPSPYTAIELTPSRSATKRYGLTA